MKTASSDLLTLLASRQFYSADLYNFTLVGGGQFYYCGGDRDIAWNSVNWFASAGTGPFFDRKYDIVRVGMLAALVVVCAERVWGVWVMPKTELAALGELMKSFSVAVANILGWGSVGCAAKARTEPG